MEALCKSLKMLDFLTAAFYCNLFMPFNKFVSGPKGISFKDCKKKEIYSINIKVLVITVTQHVTQRSCT